MFFFLLSQRMTKGHTNLSIVAIQVESRTYRLSEELWP
ncbi:hypothetical protein AMTRI_Chr02g220480 [Amborella trichopoda]